MNRISCLCSLVICLFPFGNQDATSQERGVPAALEAWSEWVNSAVPNRNSPRVFSDYGTAVNYWPSQLTLDANVSGATWKQQVTLHENRWIPIPGNLQMWPTQVQVDGLDATVIGRNGRPCIELQPGSYSLQGRFNWSQMPQKINIPAETGVLSLTVSGESRPLTSWSENGEIWLRRVQRAKEDVDRLGVQVYRVIEDGIPVWLRTEIELTVSGKSREEELGWILPQGWRVGSIESPIPVAIDELGRIKTQVRAGKWSIQINAFSTSDPGEIIYPEGSDPVVSEELVGLKQDNSFRVSYIEDLPAIDLSQTTFPDRWRGVPVYQWDTNTALRLREKQRGMGEKGREGLEITREMWLDDDGAAFTYEDRVKGTMQEIWRLDAASSVKLGSVRINGESQLITASPDGAASGVELRNRNIDLNAIGRSSSTNAIQATGWEADADALSVVLTLPPGWRAIAVFGADRVIGDWMTAWSLLDLFLLMIFSLAVFRMYGLLPGVVALFAFSLSYHEYGSPRWTWFCVLIPLALSKVVSSRTGQGWLNRIRFIASLLLISFLLPFIAHQLQSVLYPQLEVSGVTYGYRDFLTWMGDAPNANNGSGRNYASFQQAIPQSSNRGSFSKVEAMQKGKRAASANLLFDPKSKIQTGPAKPTWSWNRVECYWNGPVTSEDEIRPILLSLGQNRILTVVRVALLALLLVFFVTDGAAFPRITGKRMVAPALAFLVMLGLPGQAVAQQASSVPQATNAFPQAAVNASPQEDQLDVGDGGVSLFPSDSLLDELRQRLNRVPSAFPNAAEISVVNLDLNANQLSMTITFHTADRVVAPIPGHFPDWSPTKVTLNGDGSAVVTRRNAYLWVLLPKGIHQVKVEGLIPDQSDWEWNYLLKPKYVTVNAPGWTISGLNREGIPGDQLLFTQDQPVDEETAAYDQVRSDPIVLVDRQLELGLISRVKTVVTRLGGGSKGLAMNIPLLKGEAVLTSNREIANESIAVRMGAQQDRFEWVSELNHQDVIELVAAETDQFVERWSLLSSPIWNISLSGIQPIFEPESDQLIPVWRPWGGESVSLALTRPAGISGDNLTITEANHTVNTGARQSTTNLQIQLECSVSSDFVLELDESSEISIIRMDGADLPQQRDGTKLLIPVSPGQHRLEIAWSRSQNLTGTILGEQIRLPIEASNVRTVINVPDSRWVLWASGPLRGPAVRFWTILLVAILIAVILGNLPLTPLRSWEWALLVIGLTQVNLFAAMSVVGWLFALEYRGRSKKMPSVSWRFNLQQLVLVFLTVIALTVLVFAVAAGLLGYPDMFILGNGSTRTSLQWFTPRAGQSIPTPMVISVSVWIYRVLMLCWALWLASSLLRWLTRGWSNFTQDGAWMSFNKKSQPDAGSKSGTKVKEDIDQETVEAELVAEDDSEIPSIDPPKDG